MSGMPARHTVRSSGASSPARSTCRRVVSASPLRWASAAMRKWSRASTSSSVRSATAPAASEASIGTSSWRTQRRTRSRWGADSEPVKSANVSVPNASAFGRAIRPCSSIHTTVGTFEMA